MPGVPSGRACDACRTQKKKVIEHALRRDTSDSITVRPDKAVMLAMQSPSDQLRGFGPTEVQV